MNALIATTETVIGESEVQTVNARDLHEFLQNKDHFSTWIKDRIEQYGFLENQDFVTFSENSEKGRPRIEYAVSLDMAKELSMVERNERGKQARQYFIACERRVKQQPAELTRLDLIKLALDSEEKRLALVAKVEEDAPKVQFYADVAIATNAQSVQEVAKVLGMGPNKLFQFMRDEGLLRRDNMPYQRYVDEGHFRVVERSFEIRGERRTYTRTMVSGKGLILIQRRLQQKTPSLQSLAGHRNGAGFLSMEQSR